MPLWQGNNPIEFSPGNIKSIVAWYDNSKVDTDSSSISDWQVNRSYELGDEVKRFNIHYISLYKNLNAPPNGPLSIWSNFFYSSNAIVESSGNAYRALRDITSAGTSPEVNPAEWERLFTGITGINNIRNIWKLTGPPVVRWNDRTDFKNNLTTNFEYNLDNISENIRLINNSVYTLNSILTNDKLLEFRTPVTGATIFCVAGIDISNSSITDISSNRDNLITNFVSVFTNSIKANNNSNYITIGCHIYSNTNSSGGMALGTKIIQGVIYDNTYNTFSNYVQPQITSNIYINLSNDTNLPLIFTGIASNVGNNMNLYLNGEKITTNSRQTVIPTDINNFNIFIGDSPSYTAPLSGLIQRCNFRHASATRFSEIIVYNSVLSTSDISIIHQYLQKRHNTPALFNNGNFRY